MSAARRIVEARKIVTNNALKGQELPSSVEHLISERFRTTQNGEVYARHARHYALALMNGGAKPDVVQLARINTMRDELTGTLAENGYANFGEGFARMIDAGVSRARSSGFPGGRS